jgi:hypothetical protein
MSEADLQARMKGSGTPPLLSPHRHLIGEQHDRSRFTEALTAWGWGAAKMAEGYQTSEAVKDSITQANQQHTTWLFWNGVFFGTRELENLHAYTLQGVALFRQRLRLLSDAEKALAGAADDVRLYQKQDPAGAKTYWQREQAKVDGIRDDTYGEYRDGLASMVANYEGASTRLLSSGQQPESREVAVLRTLATAMVRRWGPLTTQPKTFSSRPYGRLTGWMETGDLLRQRATGILAYVTSPLDVFGDGLNDLVKAAARGVAGSDRHSRRIDAAWAATRAGGSSLKEISKTREIFMLANINGLPVPGLVQLGEAHVRNLKGKAEQAKYHADYDAFVADTTR